MTDRRLNNSKAVTPGERRKNERRSPELLDDIIDRRRLVERRVICDKIESPDKRKSQRRKPLISVDIKERRENNRRHNKTDKP